jgi:hypothetical protein
MPSYEVRDRDGVIVREGTWIFSLRGTAGVFAGVTQGPEFGEARIQVKRPAPEYTDLVGYRASTFGLSVVTLCGVLNCNSPAEHSTRDHGKEFRK